MTLDLTRRRFLIGAIAAPVVIRTAGLLMPIKVRVERPQLVINTIRPLFRITAVLERPAVCELDGTPCPDIPGRSYLIKGGGMDNVRRLGTNNIMSHVIEWETSGMHRDRAPDLVNALADVGHPDVMPGKYRVLQVVEVGQAA